MASPSFKYAQKVFNYIDCRVVMCACKYIYTSPIDINIMPRKARKHRAPFHGGFYGGFEEDVVYDGVPFGEPEYMYPREKTDMDLEDATIYLGAISIISAIFLAIGAYTYFANQPQ